MSGISVGQLVKAGPRARDRMIATLSPTARMRLTHLAALGIARSQQHLREFEEVVLALTCEEVESRIVV